MHSMQSSKGLHCVRFIMLKESITRSISKFQQLSHPTIKIKKRIVRRQREKKTNEKKGKHIRECGGSVK